MKKIISLFLAAAVFSFTGCNKTDSRRPEGGSGSSTEQKVPVGEDNIGGSDKNDSQTAGRLSLLCSNSGDFTNAGCGTSDGYYSVQPYVSEGDLLHITYIDYASGQEVILCADSSCKHDSERCTSVIGTGEMLFGDLFFYDKHLYCLLTGPEEEGTVTTPGPALSGHEKPETERTRPALYRMNPDGTGRELLYTFNADDLVEHIAVGEGNSIWFITKTMTLKRDDKTNSIYTGAKNRVLTCFDLSERKIVEQIPISDSDNIDKRFIGVYGTRFIFSGIAFPDGKSKYDYADELDMYARPGESDPDKFLKFMSRCEYVFFALDADDRTIKEIYRAKYNDAHKYICFNDRLYITAEDNSVSALDLNTGSIEDFYVPENVELGGFIGGRPLYISTDGNYTEYFIDPDSGVKITPPDYEYLVSVNGDSALTVYQYLGTREPDGGLINLYCQYATIALDDLFGGRENFKLIDMLERNG